MKFLFVVDRRDDWLYDVPGTATVAAHDYLGNADYGAGDEVRVINLCRTDRYQGSGYYVSLLAEARGHEPLPDAKTLEDLQSAAHLGMVAADLEAAAERALADEDTREFELVAYFGQDAAQRHTALARHLFQIAPAPLLRAHFERSAGRWRLTRLRAFAASDPTPHRPVLMQAARHHCTGRRDSVASQRTGAPRIAILCDPAESDPPSNAEALRRFRAAAASVGLRAEIVGPADIDALPGYDGLFIRTTTNVSHYTYEFSRRAAALGLVVIDDPDSILKCTNKVYLHELMTRHGIPTPRTISVQRHDLDRVVPALGLPCILKLPDSAFSLGVVRVDTEAQLHARAQQFFARSELLIAQEWLPTPYDWRVCVLDRRPLAVCRYFMAPGHWQVIKRESAGREEGVVETLAVAEAPETVVAMAVRAANLIGSGLYGVDLKQADDRCCLIEINDNPNLDAGNEDRVLGQALYREVMGVFARRIGQSRRTADAA